MKTQAYFYFICNLLTIFGLNRFLKKLYGKKKPIYSILGLISYYIIDDIIAAFNTDPKVFFVSSIGTFLLLSIYYSRRISLSSILSTLILQTFSVCSELIASFIVSLFSRNVFVYTNESIIILTIIIAKIVQYFLLIAASAILKTDEKVTMEQHFAGMLIMPTISVFQVVYIFNLQKFDQNTIRDSGSIEALLAVFSIVIVNILSCFTVDKQRKVYTIENEKKNLQTVIKMQQEYYDKENKNRELMQRMRHDYKNFLLGLRTDIASGHTDDAISIIDTHLQKEYLAPFSKSNILPVDSVLSYKSGVAKNLGITIIPEFVIKGEPQIESSDLSILIGNPIDNAIEYLEANKKCKQFIYFRMVYDKGLLDISIENEIENPIIIPDDNKLVSTKGASHGFGLRSAEYIAQKYSGKIILSCPKNSTFLFYAMLYC